MITKYTNGIFIGFDNNIYSNGCVVFENGVFKSVQSNLNVKADTTIDLGGKVVMPSLSNMFVKVKDNFNNVINYLIDSGVTNCVLSGNLSLSELQSAKLELGNVAYAINVNKLYPLNKEALTKKVNEIKNYVMPVLLIEDILNLTESEVETIYLCAKNLKLNLFVYANENLEQVGICHNETKQTPIELIESYGLFDLNLTILKCQSVDKYDLEILNKYNANIVIMPIEDMLYGDGITPIVSMLENNLNLSLSVGYNNNFLNILRIIKLTQNAYLNSKNAVSAYDLLKMACKNKLFNINGILIFDYKVDGKFDIDKFLMAENKTFKLCLL